MKVLKIKPKDRLIEYTHIEIQGITIPISHILDCESKGHYAEIEIYGEFGHHKLRFRLKDNESSESIIEQVLRMKWNYQEPIVIR